MRSAAVPQNLSVTPEKVTLTLRTKIAESNSLADQRNQALEQIGHAAEVLRKFERYS
jgi:hypothetical protein